ncbi:MAG: HlyD family efflux transporter periplasmic adaptor subunit [Deltaproteobacteria bacterium]|nr:MAG: HlyD family efflux transporter periplasmic adaptor subunit [Deltaproteobacteria bacterium]
MNVPPRFRLLLILPVLALAAFLLWRHFAPAAAGPGNPRLSGNIEVTDAEVSFRIAGHVRERLVKEGDRVGRGAVVARLESADLEQEVALRQAEVAVARATLAELEAGYRAEEVAQARAAVAQARAELTRAEADWHRQRALFAEGAVAARETEALRAAFDIARGRAEEAGQRLALLEKGFRPEQVAQARARLQQAEAAMELARTRLGYAELTAPFDAVVLAENAEPGEFVAAGTPVVTIGVLDPVWLRAYISELDLGRVKLGQTARVTIDTFPGKSYRGTVTFIAQDAEFTPKNVQTEKERVKLVYRLKITIPNPDRELKPGMPADAEIDVAGRPAS